MNRKLLVVVLIVAIIGVTAFILLTPAGTAFIAARDPIVQSFPTSHTDMGTNCGSVSDSGNWANPQLAFVDDEPPSDSTSASASGNLPNNICDDWTGFGFNISADSTIVQVLVTFQYR